MRRILIGLGSTVLLIGCYAFTPFPDRCHGDECLAFIEAGACDQSLAPSVPEASVVYVSPNGTASGTGSKDSPVSSIHAALAMLRDGKTNLFVCKGTYNENVILAGVSNVSLYGGFSCNDWTYTCEKPAVAPLTGYALEIDNLSSVSLTDMHFEAQKRVSNGESSIAAFVNKSSAVTFTRVELVANAAAKGNDGNVGTDGEWATTTGEKNASTITPGQGVSCTCKTGGSTSGGNGGAPAKDGSAGTSDPSLSGLTPPQDGAAGSGDTNDCSTGMGHKGADAPAGSNGDAIMVLGKLTVSGWAPSNGNPGKDGAPGQGGGGGGGNNGAGGGGGCGGCGGAGGAGGTAGGSSIALLSFGSSVRLISCDLSTGQAGNGGAGGNGGSSIAGGSGGRGDGDPTGCNGGNGGQGGAGGAGSGGAGGISAGILYAGTKPTLDTETTIHPGAAGTHGGAGISGKPSLMEGNPGPEGLSGKMVSADDWTVTP